MASGSPALLTRELPALAASHKHGQHPLRHGLSSPLDALTRHDELMRGSPLDRSLDPERLVFLDIETAGLDMQDAVFCVGVGRWRGGLFHVKQLLITDPAHRRDLCLALQVELAQVDALVTFNGHSFDVPRLMACFEREDLSWPLPPALPHLDLLLVARALRGRRRGRRNDLATLEAELLKVSRVDDVPGREIPAIWRSFLLQRDLAMLDGVLEHNRQDLLSMVALLGVLARIQKRRLGRRARRVASSSPAPALQDAQDVREVELALVAQRLSAMITAERLAPPAPAREPKKGSRRRARAARPQGAKTRSDKRSDKRSDPPAAQPSDTRSLDALEPVASMSVASLGRPGLDLVGARLAQLDEALDAMLERGEPPLRCLPLAAELVALRPDARHMERLALVYGMLGMSACAAHLIARRLDLADPDAAS